MKIGYARVSTGLQNLDLQLDSLKNHGCDKIFTDKISGTKSLRPGLTDALDFLRPGDSLVIWRLDRLGRTMKDLIDLVNTLNEREIALHSIEENITMDNNNPIGQLIFHLFAAFAEFERNLIIERTAAGRAAARARGRVGGRPEKLNDKDIKLIKTLAYAHVPVKSIAEQFSISRTTVYKYLNK